MKKNQSIVNLQVVTMKMLLFSFLIVITVGCSAMYIYCRYTPTDIWGCGYQVSKMQDNLYNISFTGSQNDNIKRIQDFALLRCADTTLENNYKFFVIMNKDAGSNTYGATGQALTVGRITHASAVAQTRTTVVYTIQCLKEKPEKSTAIVYDAEQISVNLKKAYDLE